MIMNTFENYLNEPYSLRFEQMQDLHRELLEEIGSDNNAFELYSDLVSIATKYAAIRAGWQQMTREDKMDKDSLRSSYHTLLSFISICLPDTCGCREKKRSGVTCLGMKKIISIIGKPLGILDAI